MDALGIKGRLGAEITAHSSIRSFQKEISERGVKGTTRSMIHRYLSEDGPLPPLDFLAATAEIIGVRLGWLVSGEGYRTVEEAEEAEQRQLYGKAYQNRVEAETAVANVALGRAFDDVGRSAHNSDRGLQEAAVRRFAQTLDDAYFPDAPWKMPDVKRTLLRGAAEFLVRAEEGFVAAIRGTRPKRLEQLRQEAERLKNQLARVRAAILAKEEGKEAPDDGFPEITGLFLESSASVAWKTIWYDAILDLFCRRVYGLGERWSSSWYDAHHPVGQRRLAWKNKDDEERGT